MRERLYYVMITEDGKIIGHAGYLYNEEISLYEIVGVVVAKDYQRQGIGKTLIEGICRMLSKLGSMKVFLHTLDHTENECALSFYRNLGFESINYERDFFAPDFHRVTFVKSFV